MRTIAVVTVGRSDYGLYLPILHQLARRTDVRLELIVAGMHLAPEFGLTVETIERDGFHIAERVDLLVPGDSPQAMAESIGRGVIGYAAALARLRPDLLVVLGDRFEMYAAAVAALPLTIPVAHIHGGELTEGAIDDALRHSMTKLSHLHFVATDTYAARVAQLGEEAWRIDVSGAPGLDHLRTVTRLDRAALEAAFGLTVDTPFLLATFHPVSLSAGQTEAYVRELLAALEAIGMPVIFTQSNADAGGRLAWRLIGEFVHRYPRAQLVDNLGTQGYVSVMALAAAMVGNSSSGLIEAPSLGLPVVNIGTRQRGRVRGANVIDVGYGRDEIIAGVRRALDPAFTAAIAGAANPYGTGHAAERIATRLASVPLDAALIQKTFQDAPPAAAREGRP